jgi:hypothetical protein
VVVLLNAPSPWVQRFAGLIRPGGHVLDVACGRSGRHLRWLAAQGFCLTGIDADPAAALDLPPRARVLVADIEAGPWPLPEQRFDAVVVTNYLWRALWPALRGALADDGVLIYETFAQGQQTVGKPSRPDFLLRPGELLHACAGLRVVAYEDGFEAAVPRFVQRIVAVQARGEPTEPVRYGLGGPAR